MKLKKLLCVILCVLLAGTALPAFAEAPISVVLDGRDLSFDVPPQIIDSRTMVPMRGIFEALGAEVVWNENDRTILAKDTEVSVEMQIENPSMTVNEREILLDVPPMILDNRTLVPVRAVAESFDAFVYWDEANRAVLIFSKSGLSEDLGLGDALYIAGVDNGVINPSELPDFSSPSADLSDSNLSQEEALNNGFILVPEEEADPQAPTECWETETEPGTDESWQAWEDYLSEEEEEIYPAEISEEEAYEAIMAMQDEYPEGMSWTNDNYYEWKGGVFSGGYGCAGFAFAMSDAAFGNRPAERIYDGISIDMLKVGDIIRDAANTHTMIVLEVHEDHVVIAEGNYNFSVHWGRTLSADQVNHASYVLTRY